jgi:hypothetical protein
MNDYERIARVIRYVDAHQAEQPRLSVLAREAGLSMFHFHRLFSTWAGVTPKNFLQWLTFSRAQGLLRDGESVLDAALESRIVRPRPPARSVRAPGGRVAGRDQIRRRGLDDDGGIRPQPVWRLPGGPRPARRLPFVVC